MTRALTRRAAAALVLAHAASVQTFAQSRIPDHLAPTAGANDALAGPLHTVTIVTADLPAVAKMYRDGLGLALSGPFTIEPPTRAQLATLWGLPVDLLWQMYTLRRAKVPTATQLRIIVTARPTAAIRQSWSRQELGPYGMGFPNTDVVAWDRHVLGLGFTRATDEIERFPLKASDGTAYDVLEATFNGPEFLRSIAISRGGGMAQVGTVDPDTGRGGPAYATQVLADAGMDAMIGFFTGVLDFEVRSDRIWRAYEIPFRFATVHAKGSDTGHVALASYAPQHVEPGTGTAPRPPSRGMAMWSFPVKNLAAIAARAQAKGVAPVAGPLEIDAPDLGPRRAVTYLAPNGFMVEVFEAG
jgi:catechol 2,3-dioxygenase-like lactoylglutathione lyase family enzyme